MSKKIDSVSLYHRLSRSRNSALFEQEAEAVLNELFLSESISENWFVPARRGTYTRRRIIGKGDLVIWGMEWGGNIYSPPHEHHKELCAPLILEGRLYIKDIRATEISEGQFNLEKTSEYTAYPGQIAKVSDTDIHSLFVPDRARTLHIYGADEIFTNSYYPIISGNIETDPRVAYELAGSDLSWVRERFRLREN